MLWTVGNQVRLLVAKCADPPVLGAKAVVLVGRQTMVIARGGVE